MPPLDKEKQPHLIWVEPYHDADDKDDPGEFARWCRGDTRMLCNHTAPKVSDAASSEATLSLQLDEPARTVLTKPSPRWHCRSPLQEWRYISPREAARLQSFPDSLQMRGNLANQYKQVGNAVPVRLALALGRTIVAALRESNQE